MKKANTIADFNAIMDALKKYGVLTREEVALRSGLPRKTVFDKLFYYRKRGVIFLVGRNQYSHTPDAKPRVMPKVSRSEKGQALATIVSCMDKMVRCK